MSRDHLLASGDGRVGHWPWTAGLGGAAGVAGDVVWDRATQSGYLRFENLAPNDPARHQYQLWIVDAARDDRFPVDGGVFDVPPVSGPVVIPVRAKIPVREPSAFVVTLEPTGGVVVSERQRVITVARVSVH
jgi:anti-sigma-K factor RskA